MVHDLKTCRYATPAGRLGSTPLSTDGTSSTFQRGRLFWSVQFPQHVCKSVERFPDLGMRGSKGLFANRQRAAIERLSLIRLTLRDSELGQIAYAQRHLGMIRAQQLLFDGEGAQKQRLRLCILAIHAMEHAEIVERDGHIGMILSMHGFINFQSLEIHRFCFDIFALPCVDLGQLRKADRDSAVLGTEFLCLADGCEIDPFCIGIVSLSDRLLSCRHGRFPCLLLTGWQQQEKKTEGKNAKAFHETPTCSMRMIRNRLALPTFRHVNQVQCKKLAA